MVTLPVFFEIALINTGGDQGLIGGFRYPQIFPSIVHRVLYAYFPRSSSSFVPQGEDIAPQVDDAPFHLPRALSFSAVRSAAYPLAMAPRSSPIPVRFKNTVLDGIKDQIRIPYLFKPRFNLIRRRDPFIVRPDTPKGHHRKNGDIKCPLGGLCVLCGYFNDMRYPPKRRQDSRLQPYSRLSVRWKSPDRHPVVHIPQIPSNTAWNTDASTGS